MIKQILIGVMTAFVIATYAILIPTVCHLESKLRDQSHRLNALDLQVNGRHYPPDKIKELGGDPADYGWHTAGPFYIGDLAPGEGVSIPMELHFHDETNEILTLTNQIKHFDSSHSGAPTP